MLTAHLAIKEIVPILRKSVILFCNFLSRVIFLISRILDMAVHTG